MSARILLLPIVTRRALADYLSGVGLVLLILTLVAFTIDLAAQFSDIRARAAETGAGMTAVLLPYLGQRAVDIVTRMMPVAAFFGTFLSEIFRRQRLESVILATSGVSPFRIYAGVLWLALLLGSLFWTLEARIRPAAIWAQVESGLGAYAGRFPPGWHYDRWYVRGDAALRGDVWRASDPYLRDVLIFQGLRAPDLTGILGAGEMRPTGRQAEWALSGVTRYDIAGGGPPEAAPDQVIRFDLIQEELTYRNFHALFLPDAVLDALVAMEVPPENVRAALTEIWRRATAWFLPGVIAFLAVGMANLGFEGRRILVARLIALAALGYWYVTAIKVIGMMGALGILAPWLAVTGPLAVSVLLGGWLAWRQS